MEKELILKEPEPGTDFLCTILPDGTARIDGYCGFDAVVAVPERMGEAVVIELGPDALSHTVEMERAILPATLRRIGPRAFQGCTALKELVIPDGVTEIGNYAFFNCTALNGVTMPLALDTLGECSFGYCTALERIILPEGVSDIPDCAFLHCGALEQIVLPAELHTVGKEAFKGCGSLKSVDLPDGCWSIGPEAFRDCTALEEITLPRWLRSVKRETFRGCAALHRVNLDFGTAAIGAEAFRDCISLERIELPRRMKIIMGHAFTGCPLKEITIPHSVGLMGWRALGEGRDAPPTPGPNAMPGTTNWLLNCFPGRREKKSRSHKAAALFLFGKGEIMPVVPFELLKQIFQQIIILHGGITFPACPIDLYPQDGHQGPFAPSPQVQGPQNHITVMVGFHQIQQFKLPFQSVLIGEPAEGVGIGFAPGEMGLCFHMRQLLSLYL